MTNSQIKTPKEYYTEVLNIIKKDSYYSKKLTNLNFPLEDSIKTIEDAYTQLENCIITMKSIGDLHSKFKRPKTHKKKVSPINIKPSTKVLKKCGYIHIPEFIGNDNNEIIKYGRNLQNEIGQLSEKEIKGFIIDFRDNGGGNMFPMLLGLGPFIERNPTAFFKFADNKKHSWGYVDGELYYNDTIDYEINNPFILSKKYPVAILINGKTASSAEMTIISLIKENMRTFGSKTKNRTTGNAVYRFEDGSKLVLATSQLTDLNANTYEKGVYPDEICNNDNILDKACEWISNNNDNK